MGTQFTEEIIVYEMNECQIFLCLYCSHVLVSMLLWQHPFQA